jgi:hypothetical protein
MVLPLPSVFWGVDVLKLFDGGYFGILQEA